MNRTLRLSGLVLSMVVTLAMMATTAAPAHAGAGTSVSRHQVAGAHTGLTRTTTVPSRATGTPRADHVKHFGPHTSYMGNDYCGGWWQGPAWCLTFNKVEAGYLAAVSLSVAAAFICAGTALITCGAAVGIAAAIQHYVDRNGVCPKSRPKMRVEYFPHPGTVSCA
jgi:hypothetical protein